MEEIKKELAEIKDILLKLLESQSDEVTIDELRYLRKLANKEVNKVFGTNKIQIDEVVEEIERELTATINEMLGINKENVIEHIIKVRKTEQGTEIYVDGKKEELIKRFEFNGLKEGIPILNFNFRDGKIIKPSCDDLN